MREILFRGRRTEEDGWAEGYLFNYGTDSGYEETYILGELDHRDSVFDIWKCADKVDPKTVGQFTGLLDKNGKKIFEGDVLELEYGVKQTFDIQDGDVRYSRGGFYIGTYGDTLSSFSTVADYTGVMRGVVVGNIHDNPELVS